MTGLDSVLLYTPPLAPYIALGAGIPPGDAVGDLGTMRDIRYPWGSTDWTISELVKGPGAVAFYASVFQTNAEGRPFYPGVLGMRPEDQFISNFPEAIYGRVAGAMIVEIFPC